MQAQSSNIPDSSSKPQTFSKTIHIPELTLLATISKLSIPVILDQIPSEGENLILLLYFVAAHLRRGVLRRYHQVNIFGVKILTSMEEDS